jgi:UDP-N-acetylmuramyl pentapeptide synthase
MNSFIHKVKKKLYFIVAAYFRFWANFSFKRWSPRVIAVTGSVGKTTLLNLLEVQLAERAHYSHNANSAFGIAFDILGLRGVTGSKFRWLYLILAVPFKAFFFTHTQEFYVAEIDGERPRETQFLASWLKPEITLWVSVGRSHAVFFDKQVEQGVFENVDDAITHEFLWLPKHTSKLVIYDAESELIKNSLRGLKNKKLIGVGKESLTKYSVWANKSEFIVDGQKYTFSHPQPKEVYVQLAMLGELATYLGEEPVLNLSSYIQPVGRSNYFKGIGGVSIIDSSFNAHLISMKSIISLFEKMQASNKWIVIGDVVEQGASEAEQHVELGRILKKANFEKYVLVGRRTQKHTLPELDSSKSVSFLHPKDAALYLRGELTGKETVVFKGSQYLEAIIATLLDNPNDAAKLPRQDKNSRKRRASWGIE